MNFVGFTIPVLFGLTFVSSAVQTNYKPYPIERYQSILERLPFGPLPANFTEDGEPAPEAEPDPVVTQTAEELRKEQQELAKTVKMSCVNIAPSGDVMVGFTDSSENPPVNLYMAVGENRKGWKVLDADYDKEWAQIVKDEVMITVKLGEGLIDAPAGSKGAEMTNHVATAGAPKTISMPSATSSVNPVRLTAPGVSARTPTVHPQEPIQPAASSFKARLAARREKEAAAEVAKEQAQKENLLKLVREATQQELEKQRQEDEEIRAQEEAQQLQQQQVPQQVEQE
ncbi:MAG: hypothetical protein IJR99_06775 [Kiritimatiellae bacterium]|nr:hypothetical protein [Kiritimatiellia bacterium]